MNRSILIIICDFLLVSLLAFSTVDLGKLADEGTTPQVKTMFETNAPDSGKDLAAVMKLALEEEKGQRDQLINELTTTRNTAGEREIQVQKYEQELKAQSQTFQKTLQEREQEAALLKQQRAQLEKQFTAAQSNVQTLNQKLQTTSADALMSKEQVAAMEGELRKRALERAQEAAVLQQQLAELSKSNQVGESERQRLATELQVAEAEKRNAVRQVAQFQEQVQAERAEKEKLADGVKTLALKSGELSDGVKTLAAQSGELSDGVKSLAVKSGELTQEIRENRPLAPNTIFSEYLANRVMAEINGTRPGIFVGETTRRKETRTVVVSDGTNTFALAHVEDTPIALWNPGTEWQRFAGTLGRSGATVPIRSLSFHMQDPRILFMPVTKAEAEKLGGKIYQTSSSPFKFQDVVLAGVGEDYYGECRFEIDTATPGYLKLDRSVVKGIFGKFNPSRGDLVFSRTGELLGIMANNTYCMMLRNFEAAATFPFGADVSNLSVGPTLAAFYSSIVRMPLKLH